MGQLRRRGHDGLSHLTRRQRESAVREIAQIAETGDGVITPAAVVEAGRPADAPLHPAFEWNDAMAAEKHREQQARQIIRCVVVTPVRGGGHEVEVRRAMVSVDAPDETADAYVAEETITGDPALEARYAEAFERDIDALIERFPAPPEARQILERIKARLHGEPV